MVDPSRVRPRQRSICWGKKKGHQSTGWPDHFSLLTVTTHNPATDGIHAHRRSDPPAAAACLSIAAPPSSQSLPPPELPIPPANWPTLIEVRLGSRGRRHRPPPSRTRSGALWISTPLGYGELQAVSVARLAAALSVPSAAAWSPGSAASIFGSPSS
jgi:hypothetical protein